MYGISLIIIIIRSKKTRGAKLEHKDVKDPFTPP